MVTFRLKKYLLMSLLKMFGNPTNHPKAKCKHTREGVILACEQQTRSRLSPSAAVSEENGSRVQ